MTDENNEPAAEDRAELQMLARLIHTSPGMAYRCLHDADWTLEFVSAGCVELIGYTPDQLVHDRVLAISDLIHPDDLANVSLEVEKAISNRTAFQCVYRIRTVEGDYKWISESGRGVFDSAGDLEALEGFLTDISAHVEGERALALLRRALGPDHELVLELPGDAVVCRIEPTRLEQILMNLAVNARDATSDGGRLTVRLQSDEDAALARMSVTDDGDGVPSDKLAMIFEPHFTTKAEAGGTGLGLAVVRSIVESVGGRIRAESRRGDGTTFHVEFPLLRSTAGGLRADGDVVGTEVVLFVEDDEAVRSVSVRELRRCGFTVLEAADGRQALKVSERHKGPIDLILTDGKMPHLNGVEMVARLREQRDDVPAILLSGDSIEAPDGLFDLDLRKPVTPRRLAAHVRALLDQ